MPKMIPWIREVVISAGMRVSHVFGEILRCHSLPNLQHCPIGSLKQRPVIPKLLTSYACCGHVTLPACIGKAYLHTHTDDGNLFQIDADYLP